MKGRKPKSSHLKIVQGDAGKRGGSGGDGGGKKPPSKACPKPPTFLGREGKALWRKYVPEFMALRKWSPLFETEFGRYCAAFERWRAAESIIAEAAQAEDCKDAGLLVRSPSGYPIQHPMLAVSNKAQEIMSKISVEFGLTIVSQIRCQGAQLDLFDPADASPTKTGTDGKDGGWGGFD